MENKYIYGLHDPGGEYLLMPQGEPRGWVLITEAIGCDPNDSSSSDYSAIANLGLTPIVRLNNGYGSAGTLPKKAAYYDFARRVEQFVGQSKGCNHWIIGNEMNLQRERPDGVLITPGDYADCFLMVNNLLSYPGSKHKVIVGAVGNWNGESPYVADPLGRYGANGIPGGPEGYPYNGYFGDYIKYFRDILKCLSGNQIGGVAIHTYTHSYDPMLIYDYAKMGWPFDTYNYNFKSYEDFLDVIPSNVPVFLTEMNGDVDPDGTKWNRGNNGWVQAAYGEINWSNLQPQRPLIKCAILYRWSQDDDWTIEPKSGVHEDLSQAVLRAYTWNDKER